MEAASQALQTLRKAPTPRSVPCTIKQIVPDIEIGASTSPKKALLQTRLAFSVAIKLIPQSRGREYLHGVTPHDSSVFQLKSLNMYTKYTK